MKDYGILTTDPDTGEEIVIYSQTGDKGLERVKRYLPEGKYYDATKDMEYRVAVREVSEWQDFAGD